MTRWNTVLAAGLLLVGSTTVLAAQQRTSPPKTSPPQADTVTAHERGPLNMWSADQIKTAQTALIRLHLYDGKPSGEMNTDTEDALKTFQRQHQMAATGMLSDSVLVLLRKATSQPHK